MASGQGSTQRQAGYGLDASYYKNFTCERRKSAEAVAAVAAASSAALRRLEALTGPVTRSARHQHHGTAVGTRL